MVAIVSRRALDGRNLKMLRMSYNQRFFARIASTEVIALLAFGVTMGHQPMVGLLGFPPGHAVRLHSKRTDPTSSPAGPSAPARCWLRVLARHGAAQAMTLIGCSTGVCCS
jgi:hypothetical protein